MLIVRFVHYLGIAMWIGGWLAAVLVANGSRSESPHLHVLTASLKARLHMVLVGPGALLTVGSGIIWGMALAGGGSIEARVAPMGASIMTGAGILGGVVVAVLVIPTALKLKAVAVASEDGRFLPVFDQQEKRLTIVSAISGLCALVSLFGAVLAA